MTTRDPSTITLASGRTLADVLSDHAAWLAGPRVWDDPKRADLSDADLRGAVLRGAVLRGAVLRGAVLRGAVLSGAVLRDAVLRDADLRGAVLSDADLSGAVLSDADLRGAVLSDAVLRGADTQAIELDVRDLAAEYSVDEVTGLIRRLCLGRVDGSCYEPTCGMACLVGTAAMVRGVDVEEMHRDSSRLAERWALGIRPGDTPETSQIVALTVEWLTAQLDSRGPWSQPAHGVDLSGLTLAQVEQLAIDAAAASRAKAVA